MMTLTPVVLSCWYNDQGGYIELIQSENGQYVIRGPGLKECLDFANEWAVERITKHIHHRVMTEQYDTTKMEEEMRRDPM